MDDINDMMRGTFYLISSQLLCYTAPALLSMVWISTHKYSTRFTLVMCVAVGLAWYPVSNGGVFYEDIEEEDEEDNRTFFYLPRAHYRRFNTRGEIVGLDDDDDDDFFYTGPFEQSAITADDDSELDFESKFIDGLYKLGRAGLFVAGAALLVLVS